MGFRIAQTGLTQRGAFKRERRRRNRIKRGLIVPMPRQDARNGREFAAPVRPRQRVTRLPNRY